MITLKVFTFVCLDIWYFLTAHISVWCISPTLENAFSFITPSLSSKTVTFSLSFFGFLHMAFIWTIKNHHQRPESPKQETGNGNVSDLVSEGLKTNCTNSISWISIKVYLLNINPLWLSLDWVVLVQLKPLLRLCQLWAEHANLAWALCIIFYICHLQMPLLFNVCKFYVKCTKLKNEYCKLSL